MGKGEEADLGDQAAPCSRGEEDAEDEEEVVEAFGEDVLKAEDEVGGEVGERVGYEFGGKLSELAA